ncbi:putative retinal-binding protein [Trichinella spiralis]|uniref:putative retinal-binding protein n=1 Tax=Trichinella spiralis TaxID=6334 RepID=UPI0001EFD370|nr:putative retinal-binding protein [Trichinella spiralis]
MRYEINIIDDTNKMTSAWDMQQLSWTDIVAFLHASTFNLLTHLQMIPGITAEEKAKIEQKTVSVSITWILHIMDGFIHNVFTHNGIELLTSRSEYNSNDVNATSEALKKHLVFRKAWGLDELLTKWEKPEVLLKYYGHGFPGYDREGSPILFSLLGNVDVEGLFNSCQPQDFVKMSLTHIEEALAKADEIAKKLLALFQENYPGACKKIIVIQAPTIAKIAFNLLGPFLSSETEHLIEMHSDTWKESLFNYIDPDKWPLYWGGNMKDENGDEKCSSKIVYGLGPVPDCYKYDIKNDKDTYTDVTVYAGNSHLVELMVDSPGSKLYWKYKTVSEDIGFAIYYSDREDNSDIKTMENIFPYIRLECSLVPIEGSVTCEKKGKYVVEFDNYYSWFSAKELSCIVKVNNNS